MKQRLWQAVGVVATVALLAGCASSEQPRGTAALVNIQVNNAERVTTIDFAPQLTTCGRIAHCPTLGVQWSSATPNRAILLVGTWGGKAKVQAVDFNARPHAPLRVRTLAKPNSELPGVTAFVVPMDTLERVAFGRDAWIRVTTEDGVIEELMHNGERSSTASDALKRLVYEAYKGTDKEVQMGLPSLFGGDKPYQPNYDK